MMVTPKGTADATFTRAQTPENVFQIVSTPVLLLALFLFFSHLQDHVPYLRLPLVLLTICLLTALVSGGLYRALVESRIGRCLTVFTLLLAVSIVFSVWKGGSFQLFTSVWLKSYAIFVIVAALLTTVAKLARAIWFSVIGISLTALSALFLGTIDEGRISTEGGRFGDPNDLAQVLIIGTCLACALLCRKKMGWMGRSMILLMISVMCLAGAKTGSRGGLIGGLVVAAVLFFQSSAAGKLRIMLACLVLAVFSIALLPTRILSRYLAILGSDSAERELSSGESGSVEARKYLLTQSLYVTAQHPLTGAGMGMFMEAEDTLAKGAGIQHGSWHETHNMYTQVSSEAGLPALFFFIGALVYGFKNLNFVCRAAKRSRDPVIQDAGTLAFWMRLALLGLVTTGFFLSVAYTPEPMVLLGMTACLERAVRIKMATAPVVAQVVAKEPAYARVAPAPVALGRNAQFSSRAVANRASSEERAQPPAISTARRSRRSS
jgi:hypothetical protein